MNKLRTLLGLTAWAALATMVALPGCAQSACEKSCEAAKDCPDVPAVFASLSCSDACDFQRDFSDSAGCGAEFDTFMECGANNTDVACETNVTCSTEALAWGDCLDASGL